MRVGTTKLRTHPLGSAVSLMCAVVLLASGAEVFAGSTLSQSAGGASARATLAFKIVIPSVLIVDSRSGIVYSNDGRPLLRQARTELDDVARNAPPGTAPTVDGTDGAKPVYPANPTVVQDGSGQRRQSATPVRAIASMLRLSRSGPVEDFCLP